MNIILIPISMGKETEVKRKAPLDLQSETQVSFDKKSKSSKTFPQQLNIKDVTRQSSQTNNMS